MMKLRRIALALAVLTSVASTQVTNEQFAAICKEALERSRVMAHLDHLTNRIGPRLTSSDNLTVACEWSRDTLRSFGIDNAHLEEWGSFPVGFNRGPWWGRMTKPREMELACNTDAWTAGTRMPSRGRLLFAPTDAEQLAAMRGKLANVWLLDPPRSELYETLTDVLEQEGGFGFVTSSRGDLLLTAGNPGVRMDDLPAIPVVRLTAADYRTLRSLVEAGEEVEVEFDIRNHFRGGPIPLYNVIADIPGTEHADEFVVVGGHIDSWDGATGATDNGTGTATTLEVARILMAIGARPKRTIRFMLWSGEEQGLLGSRAWVQAHRDEMEHYSACLVHDGGTNYVSGIAGMAEMHPQLATVFAPVIDFDDDMPFRVRDIEAFRPIGSDHESFTAAGVPGFFWDQSGRANYMHTHHTQFDTYDAAVEEYQKHSSVVIATGALGIANLPELLTRENMRVDRSFGGRRSGSQRRMGVQIDPSAGLVVISVVDDSPAARAGLKAGDRILKVGDVAVASMPEFGQAVARGPASTTVTIRRGDEELTLPVTFPQ
ncbi:MAG: M20/M25/M40 family metallo-hydrolase [Planctomycetes bacterium]|nr:M20/M25/M40 family metallo-hydrolase [Planctomycetota bacterium]